MADPCCVPPIGYIATFHEKGYKKRQVVITEMVDDENIAWRTRKYKVTDISTGQQWEAMGQTLITKRPFWQVVPVDTVLEDGTIVPECTEGDFDEPMEEEQILLESAPKKFETYALKDATGRFVNLSDADLDQMALDRVSTNTKNQTKWGVGVLRGKCNIFVHCVL